MFALLILLLAFPATVNASPQFSVSLPETVIAAEEFTIAVSLSELESSSYYLKARLGASASDLGDGQTCKTNSVNCTDWLSDTTAWTNFPTLTPENGTWNGGLVARTTSSLPAGAAFLKVSLRKVGTDDNISHGPISFTLNPAPTPTPTTTPTITPTPSDSPTPTISPTATPTRTPSPTRTPTTIPTQSPTIIPTSLPPTHTSIPTKKPTPTLAITPILDPSDTAIPTPEVLSLETTVTQEKPPKPKVNLLGIVLIGIGCAGLFVSVMLIRHASSS